MSQWIVIVLLLVLAGCSGGQDAAQIPTLMILESPSPTPNTASQTQLLNFAEPVSGTLTLDGEANAWRFAGQQGDSIRLSVAGPGMSIQLSLQTPDGTLLAEGSDIQVILPTGGLYTILARLVSGAGDYTLFLDYASQPTAVIESTRTPLPQVVGVPTPTPPYADLGAFIGKLTSGTTLDGTFNETASSHVYLFDGTTGQYVNIEMSRVSGAVDPVLTLFTPAGQPVATDDNGGGNRSARLRNIRLYEDGLYSLQASGDGFLGGYRITFTSSASPIPVTPDVVAIPPTATPVREILLTPTLATAVSGNRLEDHAPVVSVIQREGDFNRFPIFASQGEVLTIGASPLPGSALRPKLEVYGPDGSLVGSASSSSSNASGDALISPLRIEATGTYLVFVTDETSTGTGEYVISYGSGSTRENIMRGEALPNQPNEGEIPKRGLRDIWYVYLNRDDVISATASALDDVFDPILELTTADGTLLAIDDNSSTSGSRDAQLPNVRIPESGLYRFRVRAAQAATTGRYALIWRYVNLAPTATPVPNMVLLLSVDDVVPDHTYAFYPFQGKAGQRIEIRVIAQPGSDFDPVAAVIGPDGLVIAEGDDSDTLNPRFIAQLPSDGTYTVRINGYLRGGPFELTVFVLF